MGRELEGHRTTGAGLNWRRSSACGANGCVEVAQAGDAVLVRDSKNPGTVLEFDRDEWRTFLAGVRTGDFDGD